MVPEPLWHPTCILSFNSHPTGRPSYQGGKAGGRREPARQPSRPRCMFYLVGSQWVFSRAGLVWLLRLSLSGVWGVPADSVGSLCSCWTKLLSLSTAYPEYWFCYLPKRMAVYSARLHQTLCRVPSSFLPVLCPQTPTPGQQTSILCVVSCIIFFSNKGPKALGCERFMGTVSRSHRHFIIFDQDAHLHWCKVPPLPG